MIYLLSEEGRKALRKIAGRSVLYAFDFDGTLTKLSPQRGNVKLSPITHEWLRELARRGPCAVVSGRALDDLVPRLNGVVPYLIGNHGIESPLTARDGLKLVEDICCEWTKRLDGDLGERLKDMPVEVEPKRYSLTLHYRGADDPSVVERVLTPLLQELHPIPQVIMGKASMNLLPPGSVGKGKATVALMSHLRCEGLFFIGDDTTDEDVFSLTEGLVMGVRVGFHPESKAGYYVKSQNEVEDVLRFLVHRIDGTPETNGSR